MSNLSKTLRCLNPLTGKRDGEYCTWEGEGKCLLCMAADEIDELEAELKDAFYDGRDARERAEKAEAQLDAVRGLRRYIVIIEASDTYLLRSVDETGRNVGTVVLNTELQAALNGESK